MTHITNLITSRITSRNLGNIFISKDFLDIGNRAAVDKTLSRLAKKGDIRRLAWGIYDRPKQHKLLGDLLPSPDFVAKALARDTNSKLQISGPAALHYLGLTTQVPAHTIYYTDGPSRNVRIGNATLKLMHANAKVMAGAGQRSGVVLQAIRQLGLPHINQQLIDQIQRQLNSRDKASLLKLMRLAPAWMHSVIHEISGH